ncbi:MAG: hypothetical protein CL947_00290 [Epsilonproteobacteria bacterium]|nr:hypothetical protein [Campylobacterota bacterium]|tara:strand:+ start:53 stop:295 length:243 start_codon:yes stop_codon:yes gene_type:complete
MNKRSIVILALVSTYCGVNASYQTPPRNVQVSQDDPPAIEKKPERPEDKKPEKDSTKEILNKILPGVFQFKNETSRKLAK